LLVAHPASSRLAANECTVRGGFAFKVETIIAPQ